MSAPPYKSADILDLDGVAHGFFGRKGGVSTGIFSSLNAGFGSSDDRSAVAENRSRCATALGLASKAVQTLHQIHSPICIEVTEPFSGPAPRADAMATARPGLVLGALAADCMPWLFADPQARIVAAAHAGWRGALAGVLDATIETMCAMGADASNIRAAVGPALRQRNFEVGMDLVEQFLEKFSESAAYFAEAPLREKRFFDLTGFARWRLRALGVSQTEDLDLCTLDDPDAYYSYRASRRAGEPDYGRNLSIIALAP